MMPNPQSQIPNPCLRERAGSRFIGAGVRCLQRPARRAVVWLCVWTVAGDRFGRSRLRFATDAEIRCLVRSPSVRIARGGAHPSHAHGRSANTRARCARSSTRSSTRDGLSLARPLAAQMRLRGRRAARRGRLRGAGSAALATRASARFQSGTRNRAPSRTAGRRRPPSASCNPRASRARCRSASRECHRRLRDAERAGFRDPAIRGKTRVAG